MQMPLNLDPPKMDPWVARAMGEHDRWLHRRCCRELAGFSQAQVEEIAQDVRLLAWRLLRERFPQTGVRPFLGQIALHLCRNARRRRKDVLSLDGEPPDAPSLEPGPHEQLERAQRDRQVRSLVSQLLDPMEQEIVRLRFACELPFVEIAARQALPDSDAVRVAMQRIKRRLGPALTARLPP